MIQKIYRRLKMVVHGSNKVLESNLGPVYTIPFSYENGMEMLSYQNGTVLTFKYFLMQQSSFDAG